MVRKNCQLQKVKKIYGIFGNNPKICVPCVRSFMLVNRAKHLQLHAVTSLGAPHPLLPLHITHPRLAHQLKVDISKYEKGNAKIHKISISCISWKLHLIGSASAQRPCLVWPPTLHINLLLIFSQIKLGFVCSLNQV